MIPLVLLPGMMCSAQLFENQINRFSTQRTVQFCPIIEHTNVKALAQDILSHAPPEFALCGLSMGGIVAMEVIRLAPHRVKAIALLDTNHLAELDNVKNNREPQIDKVKQGGLLAVMRDEMKPNYLAEGESKAKILDLCLDMAMELGKEVFINQSIALRDRPDQTSVLRSIRVPSLVLCGEHDRLCPPSKHKLMHELIAGSTLRIVDNAGHLPVLEQPELTNNYLQAWLERV